MPAAVRARVTGGQDTVAAAWPITLPPSVTPGELLFVFLAHDTATTTITGLTNGWQQLGRQAQGTSTNHTGYVLWKRATGVDALTVTLSTGEQGTWISEAVTGAHPTTDPIISLGGSYGVDVSPQTEVMPTLSGLPVNDYLAILAVYTDASTTTTQTFTAPAGYGNPTTVNPSTTDGAATFTCDRSYTAVAVITPGSATWQDTEQGVAFLVAVPPAPSNATKTGTDTHTLTESGTLAVSAVKTGTDTLTVTEGATLATAAAKAGTDTLALTETAALTVIPRPPLALPTVAAATADAQGAVPAASPTRPAGLAVNDYLICVQLSDADGSLGAMTAGSGWAPLGVRGGQYAPREPFVKLWGKVATAADVTADAFPFPDSTGADGVAGMLRIPYGAYDPDLPVQAVAWTDSTTPQNTHRAPSVAGTPGALLVTVHAVDADGVPCHYTPPTGMTEHIDAGTGWAAMGVFSERITTTGPTGERVATLLGPGETDIPTGPADTYSDIYSDTY